MPDELDLLAQGDDRPTVLERCRQRLREGPVGTGLREHPRLAAAGCAGVVVAAAVVGYVVLILPPPVDPHVRLEIDPVGAATSLAATGYGDDAWLGADGTPTFSARFRLTTDVAGDVVRVVGVVGPGLTSPEFFGPDVTAGAPVPARSTAKPDCGAGGWATSTDADYRLRVTRTDAYSRQTDDELPVGRQAAGWRALVRRECLRHDVAALPADQWRVAAAPGRPDVALTVRIRNPHEYPLWLRVSGWAGPEPAAALVPVAPGAAATLRSASVVTDCAVPSLESLYRDRRGRFFLPLQAGIGDPPRVAPLPDDALLAGLPVSTPLAEELGAASARACLGAPPATSAATAIHPAEVDGAALGWRVDVRFRTTADSLAIGPAALDRPPARTSWLRTTTRTRAGPARPGSPAERRMPSSRGASRPAFRCRKARRSALPVLRAPSWSRWSTAADTHGG